MNTCQHSIRVFLLNSLQAASHTTTNHKSDPFLIIDEFQRLAEIDEGIIGDIQQVWDRHHAESHIHLIACGSIFSMMQRLFEDRKEPLLGRKTARIELKPFSTYVLKTILHDHNPDYTAVDLLMLYAITGGVAKYVAQLMDDGCTTWEKMLKDVCQPSSVFIEEGTELLVGEFGRRFQTYYSILQLIASGMTNQSEADGAIPPKKTQAGILTRWKTDIR